MKKILFLILGVVCMFTACDDTTDTLGSSLTKQEDLITVSDGIYKITSRSVVADSVLSRNTMGYLGTVKDPETGTYINSNFMTQFHVFENYSLPDKSILSKGIQADSCEVRLFYNSYYGDSLTSMKATLYELEKPAEETRTYYSSFNPEKEGYVRLGENALKVSKAYSLINKNYSDSHRESSNYVDNITFKLNVPYTDRNGKKYNNYGSYLMEKYYKNPDNFKNSYNFIHNVCPGFYIKTENGVGCMAYIYLSQLNAYFTYKDSTEHTGIINFAGTEEVRQVTEVQNDKARIKELAEDNTCTYVKAPAGIYTELTLPVEEICKNHENDSINSAKVVMQCLTNATSGKYAFSVPKTLLMVRSGEAVQFFENNKVANNRTNYVASYSSSTNNYSFNNIGELIKQIYAELPSNEAMREEYKRNNPQWNKVLLIPVSVNYANLGQTTILSRITNDMSLSSVRLVGGSQNPYDDIEVSVIYSKFTK